METKWRRRTFVNLLSPFFFNLPFSIFNLPNSNVPIHLPHNLQVIVTLAFNILVKVNQWTFRTNFIPNTNFKDQKCLVKLERPNRDLTIQCFELISHSSYYGWENYLPINFSLLRQWKIQSTTIIRIEFILIHPRLGPCKVPSRLVMEIKITLMFKILHSYLKICPKEPLYNLTNLPS